jgi:C4-dicarboxylate-specific signal transduction histidine kinase
MIIQFLIKVIVGELPQVLINIINNAKDILIEKQIENPWIKISLKKKTHNVKIFIEDNGGGVPDEILPKIFEPYFTTKHQSKGTGLGLYMSYKIIVQSLNGELHVKNTENGAKFTITLPLNN